MHLKRISDKRDADLVVEHPRRVSHVVVRHESKNGIWNVGHRTIDKGLAEGWLAMGAGKIVLKTAAGEPDVEYRILRAPGYYCVYCGAPVDATKRGLTAAGKAHMATHAGETLASFSAAGKLPKPLADLSQHEIDQINNPSGYAKFNDFRCERIP